MSGDVHGAGLDLDAIEARAGSAPLADAAILIGRDVPALVAEVRRLRAQIERDRANVEEGFARVEARTRRDVAR